MTQSKPLRMGASMRKKGLFSTPPSQVCSASAEKDLNSVFRQSQSEAAAPSKPSQENCRSVFCPANQQAESAAAKLRDLSARPTGRITRRGAVSQHRQLPTAAAARSFALYVRRDSLSLQIPSAVSHSGRHHN